MRTKLVLKAKQTAHGTLKRTKARIVARGDMEKRHMKKNQCIISETILKHQALKAQGQKPPLIELPDTPEDTWAPCATSCIVKMLIAYTCAANHS